MTLRISILTAGLWLFVMTDFGQAQFPIETVEPPLAKDLPKGPTPPVPPANPPPPKDPLLVPPVVPAAVPPQPPALLPSTITQPETNGEVIPTAGQVPSVAGSGPPIITLHIQAPPVIAPGKDIDYRIEVANVSSVAARNVVVVNTVPQGAVAGKSDPPSTGSLTELSWSLGTMGPGARKSVTFSLKPPAEGTELTNIARVHFEFGQKTTTKIARPSLTLKRAVPAQVQQLDVLNMRLEVSNPGISPVEQIQVIETLPPGLTHKYDTPANATNPTANDPQRRVWTIGRLGPNEVRAIEYRVEVQNAGAFPVKAEAVSNGGARGEAAVNITAVPPKMDLEMQMPARQTSNQPAVVKITLRNSGPGVLRNVRIDDRLPPQTEVISASHGGLKTEGQVQWMVPALNPGESRTLELTVRSPQSGRLVHTATATYRGIQKQVEGATEFDSSPSLSWNVSSDTTAVEVGGSVRLTIVVENRGSAAATQVSPAVIAPDAMMIHEALPKTAQQAGQRIVFEPITLGPNDKKIYEVTMKVRVPAQSAAVMAELSADIYPNGPVRKPINVAITGERPRP